MSKAASTDIPQKIDMDDGYLPLARTAILTLSKTRLSGAQRAIVDVIFTQTYGYQNDESPHQEKVKKRHTRAQISYEFFMQATWMGKQEVIRAINALVKWRIIGRDKNTTPYTYWFNVEVSDWDPGCWRVSRIANSKQDSEQLAGQHTERSQDSERSVSRIANCSQASALEPQGLADPLNKNIKNKNRKNKESYKDTLSDYKAPRQKFFDLDNLEKVQFFKTLPDNEKLALLVIAYNNAFPEQAQKYGVAGSIKARKEFEGAIKSGVPPEKILIEILWNQEPEEPTPWELVNCLKGQRGLEQTQAQIIYSIEKYDREVGIKSYGTAKARDAPQH